MPSPAGGPVIGLSLSDNLPEVATSRPAISLSRVLLPQPLGPSRLTNSPLWIASETLVRASTSPRGEANDFDTLSIRMCGLVAPDFSVSLFVIGDKPVRSVSRAGRRPHRPGERCRACPSAPAFPP